MIDTITSRIALARGNLTAKLDELRRRGTHVRSTLSPIRSLGSPWIRVGIAALVGYRLGLPRSSSPMTTPPRDETLTHAIVRASVLAFAQAFVRRAVVALVDGDPSRHV